VIVLIRQLSEVNIFQHHNSGQQKAVISSIVDVTRAVEGHICLRSALYVYVW